MSDSPQAYTDLLWPTVAASGLIVASYYIYQSAFARPKSSPTSKKGKQAAGGRPFPVGQQAPVMSCRVTRLFVHPVKSLDGFEAESAEVLPRGLRYDREWLVVRRRDNKVMTIREIPAMRRVKAEIDGGYLVLTHRPLTGPTASYKVSLQVKKDADEVEVDIWDMKGTIYDEGATVAAFLTKALSEGKATAEEELYLGRMVAPRNPLSASNSDRILDENLRIRGQDGSSLHILTEESLLWVQKQLENPSLCAEVYRPNIVVEGVPFPEEDCWDTMLIRHPKPRSPNTSDEGANSDASENVIRMKTLKLCDRCAIPTTDLKGGRDKDFMPTKFLRTNHGIAPSTEGKPSKGLLGLNVNIRLPGDAADFIVSPGASASDSASTTQGAERTTNGSATDDQTVIGVIRVGDELVVTSRRNPPNYL